MIYVGLVQIVMLLLIWRTLCTVTKNQQEIANMHQLYWKDIKARMGNKED